MSTPPPTSLGAPSNHKTPTMFTIWYNTIPPAESTNPSVVLSFFQDIFS